MPIQLEKFYNNVEGVSLSPGLYADNDPRLRGLGSYLVANGHASLVEIVGTPYNIGIDNAVDGAELSVAFALTDEQETPIVSDSPELEELELRQRYEELEGKKPHPNMKLETLRAKVAELEA